MIVWLKRRLRQLRNLLGRLRRFFAERRQSSRLNSVVAIECNGTAHGRVLLSYRLAPFLLSDRDKIPHDHTYHWESLQIARTFLQLGYSVDVIDYHNKSFQPRRNYAFFIDIRWNMQRLAPLLNPDCIKISHHDTAHILFHDNAELKRLLQLQQRRGLTLSPQRYEWPNLAIEHADYATVIGNDFTLETYSFAAKPLFRVPVSTPVLYDWPNHKKFDQVRTRFLWLSSRGMVHKGLDLLLDAFLQMPGYELYICGPVQGEPEFVQAFSKELYATSNIHTLGWIDIASKEFMELTCNCVAVVYASCSEGQSGAVITCMHAGLIPIVSRESGVNADPDFGIKLSECSVEEIVAAVEAIANLPTSELERMARRTWEYARANNTRETFAHAYRSAIQQIMQASAEALSD
jgi:glycosyltransferase involved in cell wall biosynthesis